MTPQVGDICKYKYYMDPTMEVGYALILEQSESGGRSWVKWLNVQVRDGWVYSNLLTPV